MKAVVMSKAGKLNIVLCDDGTFRKIKGSYEIGQTLEVRKSDFIQPRKISAGAVFSGLAAGLPQAARLRSRIRANTVAVILFIFHSPFRLFLNYSSDKRILFPPKRWEQDD
jgi:hypothetical protein